ncbi:MAG: methyltransferase domain-containing protein [Candidatus Moranbacteria bacterium]|nr:methyltransferase domain-containing protein [Candidatus Moranbacteria bacterium]
MFEGISQKTNKENVVNGLWSKEKNRDLIGRDFSQYLKNINDPGMTEDGFLKMLQKGKVLDVACGEGGFIRDCLEKNVDIFGVDLAFADIANVERLTNEGKLTEEMKKRIFAVDATVLPFEDDSFETIFNSSGAFSYTHTSIEVADMLHEQIRVLSIGGKIIINPVEIHARGFCPANFVNSFLNKESRLSEENLIEMENIFSDEITKLLKEKKIAVELNDECDDANKKEDGLYGTAIITKLS